MTAALNEYRLLGRSGLRVSPIALGGASFGEGFGAPKDESRRIFDCYVERGGNFIDVANTYNDGASESYLGEFLGANRSRVVVATKFASSVDASDPNAGGSHRKSIVRALEESLKRLKTDYVDLYQMHFWDFRTPIEEVLRAQDDLTRAGKILYLGVSNTPAWLICHAQSLADRYGWNPFISLQTEYNLIQRTAEHELLPMAAAMGIGVTAWSPIGGGILTGKYRPDRVPSPRAATQGKPTRADMVSPRLTARNFQIVDQVAKIAAELGVLPLQVALRWVVEQPGIVAPIVGCRSQSQLVESLDCLSVRLSEEHRARLTEITRPPPMVPHDILYSASVARVIEGELKIENHGGGPWSYIRGRF